MRRRTTKEESIAFLVPEKKKLKKMLLLLSNNMRRRTKNKWKNPAFRDISGGENSLVFRLATRGIRRKKQAT